MCSVPLCVRRPAGRGGRGRGRLGAEEEEEREGHAEGTEGPMGLSGPKGLLREGDLLRPQEESVRTTGKAALSYGREAAETDAKAQQHPG